MCCIDEIERILLGSRLTHQNQIDFRDWIEALLSILTGCWNNEMLKYIFVILCMKV